jgi:hypothetical protein
MERHTSGVTEVGVILPRIFDRLDGDVDPRIEVQGEIQPAISVLRSGPQIAMIDHVRGNLVRVGGQLLGDRVVGKVGGGFLRSHGATSCESRTYPGNLARRGAVNPRRSFVKRTLRLRC